MQVAQVAVPLLMHSAGLPGGADVLWKALDEDFHSEDWRVRTIILVSLFKIEGWGPNTYIGDKDPNYNTKISIFSFTWADLAAFFSSDKI